MPARQETTNDDATVSPLLSALPTVHGRVVARRRLTEDLLEVTLAGFGAVDGRPWVDRLTGGDQFVFALVSPEPGGIRPGYRLADLLERRPADPVRGAYYTVRCSRPGADELDLWVVDHGAPGSVGEWMSSASGGDAVALWGPRCGFRIPEDARRVLFVADETGLAAVGALIGGGTLMAMKATAIVAAAVGLIAFAWWGSRPGESPPDARPAAAHAPSSFGAVAASRPTESGPVVSSISSAPFIDPDADQIKASADSGAKFIELHTGRYAEARKPHEQAPELAALGKGCELAIERGLRVNAGHGLTYWNVYPVAQLPGMEELNIGHSIISRAALVGLDRAVREMKQAMRGL